MTKKLSAALASIGVNSVLMAAKIVTAWFTGSIAMYAEAAHSLFDLAASVLSYLGIRKAGEPEDETHLFGHDKFENLSSLLQALLIIGTAIVILFEAYGRISRPAQVDYPEAAIALMLVSIPVAYLTSKYLSKVAKKEGSPALEGDAAHFTSDMVSSLAVLVGLITVKFGFGLGDPLSAIVVAIVMLYISLRIFWKSVCVFMDFSPSPEIMDELENVVRRDRRITRYHKLRARLAGSSILVEVHLQFPHRYRVKEAHKIAHEIEAKMIRAVPWVKEVSVHIEPD